MGKASRSNSKKAVKRSRRALLLGSCQRIKQNEEEKQQILQRVLQGPKAQIKTETPTAGPRERRRGRVGSDDDAPTSAMETDRPVFNVTQKNAAKRQRQRRRGLRRDRSSHPFIVPECERRRIEHRKEKSDSTASMERSFGLTTVIKKAPSVAGSDQMDIAHSQPEHTPQRKRLAPGSDWLHIKKIANGRRIGKKRIRGRYRLTLKGITQHYPIKQEAMAVETDGTV